MPKKFQVKSAPKCTVCKKSAYPAESVNIFSLTCHKLCFNCTTCAKKLTLGDAAINSDTRKLFCKTHIADQLRTNDGARFETGPKNVAAKMTKEMEKNGKDLHATKSMQGGLLQEDLDFIRNAKYDKQLERQVQDWIEHVTNRQLSDQGDGFVGGLSDGVILCYFMQTLCPGSIPKIQESSQPFKQMENLKHFLTALRENFKFAENEVFSTLDLREEKNLNQVLQALCTLHRKVQADSNISHFVDGYKLVVRDMSGEVEKAEKELAKRRKSLAAKKTAAPARTPAAPAATPAATPAAAPKAAAVVAKTSSSATDYSTSEFYMMIGDDNHGPYTGVDMSEWYTAGSVSPDVWCSCDGGDWKQAKDFFDGASSLSAKTAAVEPAAVEPAGGGAAAGGAAGGGVSPTSEFYMMIGEDNHGPYTGSDMSEWYTAGSVSPDVWCSCDGGDWKQAKDFFAVVSGGSGETKVETAAAEPVAASDEWMMLVGEETHGPYALAELQSWVSDGAIDPGTWVSNGGEWVVASEAK